MPNFNVELNPFLTVGIYVYTAEGLDETFPMNKILRHIIDLHIGRPNEAEVSSGMIFEIKPPSLSLGDN